MHVFKPIEIKATSLDEAIDQLKSLEDKTSIVSNITISVQEIHYMQLT